MTFAPNSDGILSGCSHSFSEIFNFFIFLNWRDAPQQDTVPWCSHLWRPEESRLWRSAGLSPSLRGVSPCRLCRPGSRFSAGSHHWCSTAARSNGNHKKSDFYTSGRLGDVKLVHLICLVAMVMVSNKCWWCDWWMKWKWGFWLKYVWIKLTHRGKNEAAQNMTLKLSQGNIYNVKMWASYR